MPPTLEAIQAALFATDGASSPLCSLPPAELAAAWERCEDGGILLRVAFVAGDRIRVVRAAMICVGGASTYERLECGPYPSVEEALAEVEAWLDDPDVDRREALEQHASKIAHWVKWVAGTPCAHAIADVVELAHAVASAQLGHAPSLAANAVRHAAEAMVEDVVRFDGAPEGPAVDARLRAPALAYLTQVVRELVPCPTISARELHDRWRAGWGDEATR